MAMFQVGKTTGIKKIPKLQQQRQKLYAEKKEGVIKKTVAKRAETRKKTTSLLGSSAAKLEKLFRPTLSSDVSKAMKAKKKGKK